MPIEQISFANQIKELSTVFADCVREEFEDDLPNATITIYVKQPISANKVKVSQDFDMIYLMIL